MGSYTLNFEEISKSMISEAGGKGVNLGELWRLDGIEVPEGFCVTTAAYKKAIEGNKELIRLLDQLSTFKVDDREHISQISGQIRNIIGSLELPEDVADKILNTLSCYGSDHFYAIRSSATAEDLPSASFAGQQDTYLSIKGQDNIICHIVKCWASLFTDRAVIYRIQKGYDHRKVSLAVIVQKMIMSEASGIMFTADPVTSDRKTISIDGGFGLGEALVSGLVNPDTYKIRNSKITAKRIGTQKLEIRTAEDGGTVQKEVVSDRQGSQTLSDRQILELAEIGKKIEAYFGYPQDIEWCLFKNRFYIVQSRRITTLFPTPTSRDGFNRVYMSIGHMQMMTDTILPLGMSFFEQSAPFSLDQAGGRLFIDITHDLATPLGRRMLFRKADNMDPLMSSALRNLIGRKDYIKSLPKGKGNFVTSSDWFPWLKEALKIYRKNDPFVLDKMLKRQESALLKTESSLEELSGTAVFDYILEDRKNLKAALYDNIALGAVLVFTFAANWLNKNIEKWLGEKNITNFLSKSVEHNITSEMGLALCSVSDVVRKHPQVIEYFSTPSDETFFADLQELEGGEEVAAALQKFLEKYGMRCPAEIDITKPRWYEKPTQLIPMIMSNVNLLTPGYHIEMFEQGKRDAKAKEEEILTQLLKLPGGSKKAKKTKRMISVFRNFVGAREYPKYFWIRRYALYKIALMKEAEKLVANGTIENKEDVSYFFFEEFREAVRTGKVDYSLIKQRKSDYAYYEKLMPPRIILADGEVPPYEYEMGKIPEGALIGIPVSPGIIEGRARVVEKLEDAQLEQGDILVTAFTDPSWTPIFVSIAGLVTEVGGQMTHGAVITREYGLPAVVGVEGATKLIHDGQIIRINGTEGYIELL